MFNSQKLIIFCLLFAAVWVQFSKAAPKRRPEDVDLTLSLATPSISDEQKSQIMFLGQHLDAAVLVYIDLLGYNVDNYVHWWRGISDDVKAKIASKFHSVAKDKKTVGSSNNVGREKELDKLAFETVRSFIKDGTIPQQECWF
uniref:Secreted salivary gland protein SSGP-4A3 n=1 Tax=Mayetiola destructor TaxID=39758 RepID=Q5DQS5_MAYDE|nr:secreted salivary gland protein SSGP-4A3 [Mayetiola destructor]